MKRYISFRLISFLLFCLLCAIGFRLAASKPLWNDELYTQNKAVQGLSWVQLLSGRDTGEGNNAPLFYLLQKWTKGVPVALVSTELQKEAICADLRKMILIRIVPVVFMSAALALLFYFFALEFFGLAGLYALLCALASPMVWLYWAEARPYPLILFFTVVQSLILLKMSLGDAGRARYWTALAGVHLLLVLTSYLSVIQVAGATVVVWMAGERSKKRLACLALPLVVAFFYRFQGIHESYQLFFQWRYLIDNIPLERIVFYGIAVLLFFLARPFPDGAIRPLIKGYARFFILLLAGFTLILLMVKFKEANIKELGLHSRFFIALTPIGIVAQVLLGIGLWRLALRDKWLGVTALGVVVLLSVVAFCHTALRVLTELRYL